MPDWRQIAEQQFDALRELLAARLGTDPIHIIPYDSYGTVELLTLSGRVLEDPGLAPATDRDTLWRNLANMYRRFESDEIGGARLRARFDGTTAEAETDSEGYFTVAMEPPHPLPSGQLWHAVELELLHPLRPGHPPVRASGLVLVPQPDAQFGIISDIDDTVVKTDAISFIATARNTFLRNAHTRLPFPGVAGLYQALHEGAPGPFVNPIFYVSSSPWNLYDMLTDFLDLRGIPRGPLLLRDWGVSRDQLPTQHFESKLQKIAPILERYPRLPFLLFGDSGQEDPEVYTEVVRRFPQRIPAIYIRDVDPSPERRAAVATLAQAVTAAGSTLLLADSTLAMAEHAAQQGWITPEALARVAADKAHDQAQPDPREALLDDAASDDG